MPSKDKQIEARKRGRPVTIPGGTRVWSKRLTESEIAAVEKLVAKMRAKKRDR